MAHTLLTTVEASEYFDSRGDAVPEQTLKQWRSQGRGPRYIKLPNGNVRYRADWLDKFLDEHVVEPERAA